MGSRMNMIIGCLIVVVALVLNGASAATVTSTGDYKVGDSLGWDVPPNTSYYSDWASTQTFFLGDKFFFNWTGTHNLAGVSKADYDNCTKVSSYIGSPVTFTPPSAGSYYFICTVNDHCERGQKLALTISTPNFTTVSESPAEPPISSASSLTVGALFAVLSTAAISFQTYMI
ncbi:hypothetical protein I3843_03G229200 [Carya illinoinensis]|uniref:Phytocyanin domain-containing protein n=1 Tax=Carya illinoinensis TaxID=32201 RepID=A0A8T1R7Z0_CARIL|nr:umecyanin-like [Carya illinoinensis]KAG2718787.1 hypothetical protein I3760_03G237400 [Carya illinoinensis]KAG6662493.1 hypothetical protein CIPAW_03G246600 [Carya illinoinensis]KAG6723964.1 hypothetical protein I3842_03G235000 [Carya illinoinensis]KAG7989251.1 hypothetical protein I3843_03G229200 [Carya illinoinensis]